MEQKLISEQILPKEEREPLIKFARIGFFMMHQDTLKVFKALTAAEEQARGFREESQRNYDMFLKEQERVKEYEKVVADHIDKIREIRGKASRVDELQKQAEELQSKLRDMEGLVKEAFEAGQDYQGDYIAYVERGYKMEAPDYETWAKEKGLIKE